MNTTYLHERYEARIGDLAHEVDARQIQLAAQLRQEMFSPTAVAGRWSSVTLTVSSNNDHSHVRPSSQDAWKCAHEDVEATIGLQIAADKSENLVSLAEM